MATKSKHQAVRLYEYRVSAPVLPPNATGPVMDHREMEWWLNDMDTQGWEFVGYGQTNWCDSTTQSWWIFRRPIQKPNQANTPWIANPSRGD